MLTHSPGCHEQQGPFLPHRMSVTPRNLGRHVCSNPSCPLNILLTSHKEKSAFMALRSTSEKQDISSLCFSEVTGSLLRIWYNLPIPFFFFSVYIKFYLKVSAILYFLLNQFNVFWSKTDRPKFCHQKKMIILSIFSQKQKLKNSGVILFYIVCFGY